MKRKLLWVVCLATSVGPFVAQRTEAQSKTKGVLLEEMTWVKAEKVLTPDAVVVIALGAEAKEHGPHLKLANDFIMAEYLKKRIIDRAEVIVAPTINYGFYPAFVDYPGSTSLRLATSRDVVVDICRTLAHYGPRRFYIINTGVSTLGALKPAAELLAADGILLRYTDILKINEQAERSVRTQEKGTHADEIETSMMLYLAPSTVDMSKAAKDYGIANRQGPLTRDPKKAGTYSPTGIFGDATLATRDKGKVLTEALVEGIVNEIETLRHAAVPAAESYAEFYDAYTGQYEIAAGNVVTITREGNSLMFQRAAGPKVSLSPLSKNKFSFPLGDLTFLKDEKGQVTHLYVQANGQEFLAKKNK